MIFDRNQSVFPSDFHREVWWWAVGIVPPDVSLAEVPEAAGNRDICESCLQWHAYFCELSADMYNNAEAYAPASARQYRDIMEKIAAEGNAVCEGSAVNEDNAVLEGNTVCESSTVVESSAVLDGSVVANGIKLDAGQWRAYRDRINRSKQYADSGVTLEACLNALARTGLKCEINESGAFFSSVRYPKIFIAMSVFERSPGIRLTPARHHFAHCEFRQLYKNYSAKYDELMRRASDESILVANAIHEYCVKLKMRRYIHFGIIKYRYKDVRVFHYNLYGNEYPTLRVNIGAFRINPTMNDLEAIFARIDQRKAEIDGR